MKRSPTKRSILVGNGTSGCGTRLISGILSSFGSIVICLDFLGIASVPYDLIIGAPKLVKMRACTDRYHQTVTIGYLYTTEVFIAIQIPYPYCRVDLFFGKHENLERS